MSTSKDLMPKYGLESHREGIPIFTNGISRKVGPPPPLDLAAEIKKVGKPPVVLTPDGRAVRVFGFNHGIVSSRSASIGVCRLVPDWPDIESDLRLKLWFLGRTSLYENQSRGPDDSALADDVYVLRHGAYGDKDAYLVLGFIGANRKRYTLDARKFVASRYALDSDDWRKLATEGGYP